MVIGLDDKHVEKKTGLATIQPRGLVEAIKQSLINAILNGVLEAGDKLVEQDIMDQFQVSKSPVREALSSLESSGLVEIKPRRGAFVREFTPRDIEENYQIRSALEGLAIRLFYRVMDPEHLRALEETLQLMKDAVEKNDPHEFWMYHHRFHDIYLEGSNNKQLIDMLKTLRMQNIWYCREVKDNLELEYSLYKELFHHLKKKDIEENEIVAFMEKEIIGLGIKNFHEYLKNKA